MNELAYLGLAVAGSAVGSFIVWFRQRRPRGLEAGVQEFSRGLAALSGEKTSRRG